MSQDFRLGRLLALVTLVGGLLGCSPLPMGSEPSSRANAIIGERLSSAQNAPVPATAPAFESTMTPSQTAAPSQKVASAATDVPLNESPSTTTSPYSAGPTTQFAASQSS